MSDDEMTDLSQLATQSGSIAYSSFSLSGSQPDQEPWGQVVIHKILRRRLGVRNTIQYSPQKVRTFGRYWLKFIAHDWLVFTLLFFVDCIVIFRKFFLNIELVQDRTTFGRSGECNISDLIDPKRISEISNIHFTITKNNVKDALCPVFLEVKSNEIGWHFANIPTE